MEPAKLGRSAGAVVGHLRGANIAVAQVRGRLGSQRIPVLEGSETVLGKTGILVLSAAFRDLVELGGVAAEDQLELTRTRRGLRV